MNQAQKEAVQAAASNVRDDLARARLQQRSNPFFVSGNGESIDQIVRGYELRLAQLEEGLS